MTVVGPLQAAPSPETVGPGLAGFLVIFGLAVATVLLLRSMVGHLRKVRYSPDPGTEAPADAPETRTSSPETRTSSPETRTSSPDTAVSSPDTPEDAPGRDA